MMTKQQTALSIILIFISTQLLHANENSCQNDSGYFQNYFSQANDPEAFNLSWAKCEAKLGNVEMAMSAYERVLIYNSENVEAIVALAKIYQTFNMNQEAQALLRSVENNRLTPQQRQIVSSLLLEEENMISTRLSAALNFGYDSNLNYNIYTDGTYGSVDSESSAFHALDLKANFVHDLDIKGGFSLQSNVQFYWQDNYSAHYYDILYGAVDAGIGYDTSSLFLYIPLVYKRTHYLDRDLYQQYGVAPRLTTALASELLLTFGMKYFMREYLHSADEGMDDTRINASVGFNKFFGNDFIYLQLDYDNYRADSSNVVRFTNRDLVHLFTGASYEIRDYVIIGVDYQYTYGTYNDTIALNENTERQDDFNQFQISLRKELMPQWEILADYTYVHNSSNYDLAAYHKQIMTLGLQFNY